ncbi:MAG TPA: zf-HC2 domain-containing protein, partial [Gemmatimonadaceae bacterium]|nr:zf-HC2 domain-containing protein [Gemmatimonadaceae bacterium]
NVEMRELLPELARGALEPATRAQVERHVAACADCASELETLRLVRAAFGHAPAIDTRRIVAALPTPPAALAAHSRRAGPRRWMDWRIAAALAVITVGGLSVAVQQRIRDGGSSARVAPPASPDSAMTVVPIAGARVDTPDRSSAGAPESTGARGLHTERAQLSIGGGVDDLDPASIEALLGALDEIDRAPIAPSVEPAPVTALPIISEDSE